MGRALLLHLLLNTVLWGQWLWVKVDSAALNHPFQLKHISVTELGNLVSLLSVHQNCGSQNKEAVTCTILYTFPSHFVKEKTKTSSQCFLAVPSVHLLSGLMLQMSQHWCCCVDLLLVHLCVFCLGGPLSFASDFLLMLRGTVYSQFFGQFLETQHKLPMEKKVLLRTREGQTCIFHTQLCLSMSQWEERGFHAVVPLDVISKAK